MKQVQEIEGFSKLSKTQKIDWLCQNYFGGDNTLHDEWLGMELTDADQQKKIEGFIENAVSNYHLPLGVAPNMLINGQLYVVPMVIEESSVVAAASAAAKFWLQRGGFHAEVLQTLKVGQLHFNWSGRSVVLHQLLPELEAFLIKETSDITANMRQRGGGIVAMKLIDFSDEEPNYFQLRVQFETCDSMGANFINTLLEAFGQLLPQFLRSRPELLPAEQECEIIMAILSNYNPDCVVRAWVECPLDEVGFLPNASTVTIANKFAQAVRIAQLDPYRAVTHNKGIFNGIDAVALATGQDFRAIEAGAHAYAARDGQYRSLSSCSIENGIFKFSIELPLAVGVVGGLTALHPIAKRALEMLGQPNAKTLMMILAATGLAQNFAAVRSLVTTGIQKGHMKMHLRNILQQLKANASETASAVAYFDEKVVSFSAVRNYLEQIKPNDV